jgi:hypothetical protein
MLDLAYRLLRWKPAERLAVAEALHHPALAGIDGALDAEYSHWLGEAEAAGAHRATGGGGGLMPRRGGCAAPISGRDCADEAGGTAMSVAEGMQARVEASEHATAVVVVAEDAGRRGSGRVRAPGWR